MSYKLMERANEIPGLRPHERCVLHNLAWRADHKHHRCYPSIDRISTDTGVSQRQVYRALSALREKKLITQIGHTKHGTVIYVVTLWANETAAAHCHLGSSSLPMGHPNTVSEPGKGTEELHQPEKPGEVHTQESQHQNQPGESQTKTPQAQTKDSPPANLTPPSLPESKVVLAWRAAHADAGLPCEVTTKTRSQLAMLAKATDCIAYPEVICTLIPIAVKEWALMCKYLMGWITGANFYWKLKPPPSLPHAGFLLKYRKYAYEYCSQDPDSRADLVKIYTPVDVIKDAGDEPPNPNDQDDGY